MRTPVTLALAVTLAVSASASPTGSQLLERSPSSQSNSRAVTPEPRAVNIDMNSLGPRDAMLQSSDRMVKRVSGRAQEKRWVWANHVIQDGDVDAPKNLEKNENHLSGSASRIEVNTPTSTQAAPTFAPQQKRWVWANHVIQDGDSDAPKNFEKNENHLSGSASNIEVNTPTSTQAAPTFAPQQKRWVWADHVIQDGDADVPMNYEQNENLLTGYASNIEVNTPTFTPVAPTFAPENPAKKRWVWADHIIQDGDADAPKDPAINEDRLGSPSIIVNPPTITQVAPTFAPAPVAPSPIPSIAPISSAAPVASSSQIYDVQKRSSTSEATPSVAKVAKLAQKHRKPKSSSSAY